MHYLFSSFSLFFIIKKLKCQYVLEISFNAEYKNMKLASDNTVRANPELQENRHSACKIRVRFQKMWSWFKEVLYNWTIKLTALILTVIISD